MMSLKAVRIPDVEGKIIITPRGENRYVLFETGRRYDPEKKYTTVERKVIGVQIRDRPGMMFPNENYRILFPEEAEEQDAIQEYAAEWRARGQAREYFDQVYFEFMMLSRRMPEGKLNANKARRINQVLRPMLKMLKPAGLAGMLELLPEENAEEITYSDAGLLLTLWKTAVNQYFQNRRP